MNNLFLVAHTRGDTGRHTISTIYALGNVFDAEHAPHLLLDGCRITVNCILPVGMLVVLKLQAEIQVCVDDPFKGFSDAQQLRDASIPDDTLPPENGLDRQHYFKVQRMMLLRVWTAVAEVLVRTRRFHPKEKAKWKAPLNGLPPHLFGFHRPLSMLYLRSESSSEEVQERLFHALRLNSGANNAPSRLAGQMGAAKSLQEARDDYGSTRGNDSNLHESRQIVLGALRAFQPTLLLFPLEFLGEGEHTPSTSVQAHFLGALNLARYYINENKTQLRVVTNAQLRVVYICAPDMDTTMTRVATESHGISRKWGTSPSGEIIHAYIHAHMHMYSTWPLPCMQMNSLERSILLIPQCFCLFCASALGTVQEKT